MSIHATSLRILLACTVAALGVAQACVLPEPARAPSKSSGDGEYWAGAALSGAWYDPERSGEGVVLQALASGEVIAVWYTYPAAGEAGEQAWLLAAGGRIEAERVRFASVIQPKGARFGAAFDPAAVRFEAWGQFELRVLDCHSLQFQYSGPGAYGSGTRTLRRLTELDQVGCAGERRQTAAGARAAESLKGRSGAWFVAERAGEGWMLEELADGRAALYWFTFTPGGDQAWLIGLGRREGESYVFDDLLKSRGGRFGDAFDPSAVQLSRVGSLRLELQGCSQLLVDYQVDGEGWGSAHRRSVRLSTPAGATCIDALPSPTPQIDWVERARMPLPYQREHAAALLDGQAYTVGGFGALRGLRRYSLAADSWTSLAQTPAGRDHPAAFAIDGHVYMLGGASNGGGDQTVSGHRFVPAENRWEPVPELPFVYGSSAVVLHGFAWIGDSGGSLHQYDPRARRVRRIAAPHDVARDHSRVLAFLDEIWVVGGREPETDRVDIYDPASGRWRTGPALNRVRGGFAAATAGNRLIVTGGEVLSVGPRLEASTEIYSAGDSGWRLAAPMPVVVHGAAAVSEGHRVWVFGGATDAGFAGGAEGRSYELRGLD
jgi:hypothetical protein